MNIEGDGAQRVTETPDLTKSELTNKLTPDINTKGHDTVSGAQERLQKQQPRMQAPL